jgi:YHS domain-containing protein
MDGEFIKEESHDKGYCRVCGKTIKVGNINYLIQVPRFSEGVFYYFCSEKCLRDFKPSN